MNEETLRIIALEYDKADIWFLKEIIRRKGGRRIIVQDDDSVVGWVEVRFIADNDAMLYIIDRIKYVLNQSDRWLLKKVV
jgi:hypothetical protein